MGEEQRLASFHLIAADGTVHSAGRALTELLGMLPGAAPLAALAGALQPATDAAYGLIAGNRDRLGPLISAGVKARADAVIRRHQAGGGGL